MKFGKVDHPELIDFKLPPDHSDTAGLLHNLKGTHPLSVYVGAAKWSRQALRNFYPRGTKDELPYYATQFNSIELNATFYRIFPTEQYKTWYESVPEDFCFFPKVVQNVSHLRRLNTMAYPVLENFLMATAGFQDKLGTIFIQMHPNFGPKNWDRVVRFVEYWPKELPLALEFRHADWYNDVKISEELFYLLQDNGMANILTDTPGRRDMLHMRLTNDEAFIRFVAANHPCDYSRIDDWIEKLHQWHQQGLKKIHFFMHQQMTRESQMLATYLVQKLNSKIGLQLRIPMQLSDPQRIT